MIIQCENCGTQHELDPPSWVVSSGRAFRFRCSACGHSQSVQPEQGNREVSAVVAPTEVPATRSVGPSSAPSEPRGERPTLAPPSEQRLTPIEPTVAPPALLDSMPPAADRTRGPTPSPNLPGHGLLDAPPPSPSPPPVLDAPPALRDGPSSGAAGRDVAGDALFLKQNGQIYRVQDWETLKRWIAEARVDHNDLVSEGGVRWEPIGSRQDLVGRDPRSQLSAPPPVSSPFPFGGDSPFATPAPVDRAWADDDTEGVPTGLPPLPTEESVGFDAPAPFPPAAESGVVGYEPTSEVETTPADDRPMALGAGDTPAPAAPSLPPPPVFSDAPPADGGGGGEWEDLMHAPASEAPTEPVPLLSAPVPTLPPRERRSVAPPDATQAPVSLPPDFPSPPTVPPGEFDAEWESRSNSSRWLPLAGVVTVLVVVVVAVAFALWPPSSNTPRPPVPHPVAAQPPPAPPPVAPVPAEPPPEPVAAVAPAPPSPEPAAPPPAPAPPTPVAPAPAPVAPAPVAPAPAQPAPASSSAPALVQKGWKVWDSDRGQAERLFRQALDVDPRSEEAAHGYGYALLEAGKIDEATPWLCKVRNARSPEIRQEVNGFIQSRSLRCP